MISSITNVNLDNAKQLSFKRKLVPLGASSVSDRGYKLQADNYAREGKFDKAVEFYKKSIEINPYNLKAHLALGKVYNYNGQYKEAIPHLEAYTQKFDADLENIVLLGECYKKSGMFSKAIEKFKLALDVEPKSDYARRNLLDAQNLLKACIDPDAARQERYDTAVKNLTEAVKIAKNFLPRGFMDDMKDMTVSFDKTSKMGGRSNIAQYEHSKRKVSVTDEYTYASPKLVGAYLIHEFVHGKDNDPYTSVREEQDAYRVQAKYWVENVHDVYDPEMDYVADLYKESSKALDDRVAEIYRLRDPGIADTSYNHPPTTKKSAAIAKKLAADQPLRPYSVIV